MQVITRKEAQAQGKKRYFTGKPCKHGHISERWVNPGVCLDCAAEIMKRYYETHREAHATSARKWREEHPERNAALLGKGTVIQRGYPNAIPADFNLEATLPFYEEARRLTRETGIDHEVDHIIPLAFGGLHSALNLQVLTAVENRIKGNKVVSNAA